MRISGYGFNCKGALMKWRLTWIGIGATAAMLALTGAASAVPLTLTGPIQGNTVGPQSTSNPCIIAGTQCQQPAGFGFNNFTSSGAISSYNMFSTTPTATVADGVQGTPYTVAQIDAVTNNLPFVVAIDVNTTASGGGDSAAVRSHREWRGSLQLRWAHRHR